MDVPSFLWEVLGLKAPWIVESVAIDQTKKLLDINISFERGAIFPYKESDNSEEQYYKAYDTRRKTWRHLNLFDYECYLHARVPRVKTATGDNYI